MPTTTFRNLIYRAALPLAPTPRGQMKHHTLGHAIDLQAYERILRRHHVLGASLLLTSGPASAAVHTSTARPEHTATEASMYRVASITKMATALVVLMLCDQGAFTLDTPVAPLLPDAGKLPALQGVALRHLLSHTSGLQDLPAYEQALASRQSFHHVLSHPDIRVAEPGRTMIYSNFGFGLVGCLLEHTSGLCLEELFQQRLFRPLGMQATLNAATLEESSIMPISRVLPYHPGRDVRITRLGRVPLASPDPCHHFGHTAGAMYTNAASLSRMLSLLVHNGAHKGQQLLSPAMVQEMTTQHAYTGPKDRPTRRYGLGLVILNRPDLSPSLIYGHQGFAYGCVDGAFVEKDTGREMIFLNGGASEAREGRLGRVNKDLLRWALQKEIPSWT